jgi:hypothetical protein
MELSLKIDWISLKRKPLKSPTEGALAALDHTRPILDHDRDPK